MSASTSEERIRELARGLEPVRRIPPLRAALAGVLALWLVALAAEWLLGGRGLAPRGGDWTAPGYLGALVGLALCAAGASAAALASAVPGRETLARAGAATAGAGMLLAVGAGLYGLVTGDGGVGACLSCMSRAMKLGIPSALLACAFLVRAAWRRPDAGAALALGGGAALGAAAVHASCPDESALHQLVAHTLVPAVAVVVLALPLARVLRRWTERRTA